MPLAPRGVQSLRCVNVANDDQVDLVLLRWHGAGSPSCLAIPLRTSASGVILCVPNGFIPQEELDEAADGPCDGVVGPHMVASVAVQGSGSEAEMMEVILVEMSMAIAGQLDKKTQRSRKTFQGFAADRSVLPSFSELNDLVASWTEGGEARLEEYYTAPEEMLEEEPQELVPPEMHSDQNAAILAQLVEIQTAVESRFQALESKVHGLQAPAAKTRAALPGPSRPAAGAGRGGLQDQMENLLGHVRDQVRRPPPRLPDEPGRLGETAVEARAQKPLDAENASTDELLKLALVKLMHGSKAKKSRRLPGLPSWESGDSSAEEQDPGWSSTSRGGRGIEAVERLNVAMKNHPEAYQERMESRMCKAVDTTELLPTVPLQFARSCPVGKSRTAGYCLQGFANVHRLLLENKPRQARLQVLRMMAALEQFLIDENWQVASRVTGMEEPPWGFWATQDLGALRRQYVYTRLAESTWIGALINELKEEEWLTKKKTHPPPKGQTMKGAGRGATEEAG